MPEIFKNLTLKPKVVIAKRSQEPSAEKPADNKGKRNPQPINKIVLLK